MKQLKIFFLGLAIIIVFFIVWNFLPFSLRYREEINIGNNFIDNIEKYKSDNGKLPLEDDYKTLKKLNPIKDYETWWPEYRIKDRNNYTLTFIEGFDGPYLIYDTETRKWNK